MKTETGRFENLSSYDRREKMTVRDALDRPTFRYLDERIDKADKDNRDQKEQIGCLWGVLFFIGLMQVITHLIK